MVNGTFEIAFSWNRRQMERPNEYDHTNSSPGMLMSINALEYF